MKSSNIEKQKIFSNFFSFGILVIFIICECLYFNIIFKSDFKTLIDNLPNNIKSFVTERLKPKTFVETIIDDSIDNIDIEKDVNELNIEQSNQGTDDYIETEIIEKSDDGIISTNETTLIADENTNQEASPSIREKKLKYSVVDLDYFNNSLFIGDSRMLGFKIYKKIPGASYFCYSSASVFNLFDKVEAVDGFGNIMLLDLLSIHKFDKIYIMLGINNLQTNYYNHKEKYKEMIDKISTLQPGAIIYIIANLHITDIEDVTKPFLNNKNINDVNNFIKGFADNSQVFYLDANQMYDDENGNLRLELSTDNVHIHIVHYDKFLVYLLNNALVEDTDQLSPLGPY